MRGIRMVVAGASAAAALLGLGLDAAADSSTLVVDHQVGDIRMGEREAQVGYDYGSDCISGCPGKQDGCVLGLSNCVGPIFRYRVAGGYLRVGYNQHRVVYLETNSARYRTPSGLGVGIKIPFGSRWGVFRWHACGPSDGYWTAGTSWLRPLWRYGKSRWWTQLSTNKGRVMVIAMWRGDVNTQEC